MKEIVNRLQENRNIERAKEIMESAGYKVSAKPERLKEAQINLKGNPEVADKLSKTVNTNLKFIHPFGKNDWYGWAGAEKLPSESDPYIYEEEDYSVLVTGYYDDPSKAWIEVYGMEDLTDNSYSYQSKPGDEAEILSLADKISAEIDQGKDLRKIARQYGLTYYKY